MLPESPPVSAGRPCTAIDPKNVAATMGRSIGPFIPRRNAGHAVVLLRPENQCPGSRMGAGKEHDPDGCRMFRSGCLSQNPIRNYSNANADSSAHFCGMLVVLRQEHFWVRCRSIQMPNQSLLHSLPSGLELLSQALFLLIVER